jgi:cytochrome P450
MAHVIDGVRHAWRVLARTSDLARRSLLGSLRLRPRLAPGGLGPGALAKFGDDQFYARKFRRHGPIFKVLWSENLTTCIVGFERARRLFAVHAHALLPMTIDIESFVPHGFLRSMKREPHARYRALFLNALRDDLTRTWQPELRAAIRGELDGLAAATAAGRSIAAPALTPALDRIATRALLTMFFGLRTGHPVLASIEAAYWQMGPTEFVYPIGPEQRRGFDTLRTLVWRMVDDLRTGRLTPDGDGVLERLVAHDAASVDETLVGNLIYMIEMGRYDVRSLMRWVLKYLSDAPTVIADLQRGSVAGLESLAESVVLETLRLDQAEGLNRAVTDDIVFDGFAIPKGSSLRVLLRESHQNAAAFAEPEKFSPCRFARQSYPADAYAPFGIGEHRCIAGQMVVRVTTFLVEELTAGYSWTVVGDGSRHRGRYHWEPAPTFELALQRRDARS